MPSYSSDLKKIMPLLTDLPLRWDGKECILEMKKAQFQWKQMEWWAFYFELLCHNRLGSVLTMPGAKHGSVEWDGKGSINWDFKASAIKTDSHTVPLNDREAMNASIQEHGEHGLIICECDVEYNDCDRSFQQWREELAGGKSDYQKKREKRTDRSRYRKTLAVPVEILFLKFTSESIDRLGIMKQGRNSDGSARKYKYNINLNKCSDLITDSIKIGPPLN